MVDPKTIAKARKAMLKKRKKKPALDPIVYQDLLSSGATPLDLACTSKTKGGFPKGKFILAVGDSESGKTFITMTCLGMAAMNSEFDNYRFIHMDPEDGSSMDKAAMFGQAVVDRLEVFYPKTLEDMYDILDEALDDGRPFIAILDSENALSSQAALKKIKKQTAARKADREEKGAMGDGKAAVHSQRLRNVRNRLRESGSIFIMISQTRTNIGWTSQFDPKTRSGGLALRFFADLEFWTSVRAKIKKDVRKIPRDIGMTCKLQMKKNRMKGRKPTVYLDFYYDTGIDNTGSCIKYLIEEGQFKGKLDKTRTVKGQVRMPDFKRTCKSFESAVAYIEDNDLESKLRKVVGRVWREVEAESTVKRKRRFA